MQAEFAFFSSRGRQGERGGSKHTSASIVAELSRNVELLVAGMKIVDAIVLLLLTHKNWHKRQLAAKWAILMVDSEA